MEPYAEHSKAGNSMSGSQDKICTLVFLRRDQQILLAMKKRGFGANRWNGVGGKIEPGETMEQALVRETIEEINVVPRAWHKVAVHDFIMDSDTAAPWHMYVHAFICDQWDGEPEESDEMAPRWFDISDIPYADMWQDDIYWLPAVLQGQALSCTFRFDSTEAMLAAELHPQPAF